jgi:hypothetical protein
VHWWRLRISSGSGECNHCVLKSKLPKRRLDQQNALHFTPHHFTCPLVTVPKQFSVAWTRHADRTVLPTRPGRWGLVDCSSWLDSGWRQVESSRHCQPCQNHPSARPKKLFGAHSLTSEAAGVCLFRLQRRDLDGWSLVLVKRKASSDWGWGTEPVDYREPFTFGARLEKLLKLSAGGPAFTSVSI